MPALFVTIALLLGSAVVIYLSCELFVNGVEWVGRQMGVGQTATGTILAAFGTALPESIVTFVAVVFGVTTAQKDLGVGAALGGPLVLATIAYATVGVTLLLCRRRMPATAQTQRDCRRLSRDQGWFLLIFAVKIGLGLVAFAWKPWLGVLFLAAYGAYFWSEMRGGADDDADEGKPEPLTFARKAATPPVWLAAAQTLLALAVIFVASRFFVSQLDALGPVLGLKPQLLALFLSPIATELPETMNAIIWVRQGKNRLALANISGAMMIQATVPTAFGVMFTPWILEPALILGAVVTATAVAVLFFAFRRGQVSRGLLAAMAGFYAVFVVALIALGLG